MKQSLKSTKVAQALLVATACFASFGMASVTINYEVGQITSSGTNVSAGTLLFISHGVDGVFNSSSWTIDSNSFLVGDDKLIKAVEINDGVASGAINGFDLISGAGANSKFTGLFIQGITSTELDYVTALLVGSRKFSTTGDTYQFGTYRTDSVETFFDVIDGVVTPRSADGKIGWILPADGATVDLSAYSNTGDYTGAVITAALATTSSLTIVIPEPSTLSLASLGLIFLVKARGRKK